MLSGRGIFKAGRNADHPAGPRQSADSNRNFGIVIALTKPPAETLPMKYEGKVATVSFTLQLSTDRESPWRSTYQIRFYNNEGSRNPQPIVHRLDVTADMPPEIEWLTPEQMKIEVPADGQQRLELRAAIRISACVRSVCRRCAAINN